MSPSPLHTPLRVLLTGAAGNLGQHLLRAVPPGVDVLATWRRTPPPWPQAVPLELSDAAAVAALVQQWQPAVVLHVAYGQQDLQRDIVRATTAVAQACAAHGVRLVHMSSDTVFDGDHGPYAESAPAAPVFPYGAAKAAAEQAVLAHVPAAALVRASLIVALDPPNASSAWIVDQVRAGQPVTLFTDELRTPIAAPDLAAALWEIVALPAAAAAGTWHVGGPEHLSRFALGLLLATHYQLDPHLLHAARSAAQPVRRPRDLRLLTTRAATTLTHPPRAVSDFLCGPA